MELKDPVMKDAYSLGYEHGQFYCHYPAGTYPKNPYDTILSNLPEDSVSGNEIIKLINLAEAFDYGLELAME